MEHSDPQVTAGLRALADEEPIGPPPMALLLTAGKKARHRRRAILTGVSLAVLAVGVTTVTVTGGGGERANQPTVATPTTATSADSPRMEVVAAIARSQETSFKLKVTSSGRKGAGDFATSLSTNVATSAFDPATATGYMRFAGGGEMRLINGVLYATSADTQQFMRYKGPFDRFGNGTSAEVQGTVDPERLFEALRDADAKITNEGSGVYRFDSIGSKDGGTVRYVGDIILNPDKLVQRVTYTWVQTFDSGAFHESKVVLEYSDYGMPVSVEIPTNVIVID